MNLHHQVRYLEKILDLYFPHYTDTLDHLEGLKIFIRNLAFLCFVGTAYNLLLSQWIMAVILWILGFLLLGYSCLLNLHHVLQILLTTHLICLKTDPTLKPRTLVQVIHILISQIQITPPKNISLPNP